MVYIAVDESHYLGLVTEACQSKRSEFDKTLSDEWYIRNKIIDESIKLGLPTEFINQLKKDNEK